uniref:Chromosome 11 open reading frame 97 n=1 Tax=Panthera tigris altaica TaxID=74533 RepID=A0A8C9KJH2_PANTA
MRREEAVAVTSVAAVPLQSRTRSGGTWKKFLYSEPHKRIKEVLEEELYIKRDECHIKNAPAVALEGIWSIRRNLPVGVLKPGLRSRNSMLPQAKYYSRHGGLGSKIWTLLTSAEAPEGAD